MATIAVAGIEQVNKNLQRLNDYPRVQKQLIQVAGRAALRPTVKAMRIATPRSNKATYTDRSGNTRKAGDLKRSIGTKSAKKTPTVIAGPRKSRRFKGFYAIMVELGTKRRTTKTGQNRGSLTGINRIGRAGQATAGTVMRVYTSQIRLSFNKYAKKAGLL